ncbi:hypothetical protein DDB_G0273243 [Dictyostelium discoideum AX4]|uniref:Uncharacterized protein n=1 Tax=Dictyostelium discoideum TaxID=44689 RepID=Q557C3_DICDI|nr:hypothetical protein DDB_G0273659 [Dictyostelium discoideum AX4]XP_644804.1 hypothetical protein DDB_G0273243 [Dictyostelium discoideum AX4]EAL70520.1 hypothetical protein DDB_G0273659 [Dictyostelium discoideum AX4]EAL70839.1 hypothetical protein DDB_G0273243 [Dictyostelium discoideum AX4]|eukprot:XP_644446.1 hypothetical protein DDB_G0273659 [Dictyostelium discoideum AX4]
MLKILIVILVMIPLLSILNAVNGQSYQCLLDCYKNQKDFSFICPLGLPVIPQCRVL